MIEEQGDRSLHSALSSLPLRIRRIKAVRLWKNRWKVEHGYERMKQVSEAWTTTRVGGGENSATTFD